MFAKRHRNDGTAENYEVVLSTDHLSLTERLCNLVLRLLRFFTSVP